MHPGQTRFPYLLITNNSEVVEKAKEISVNGVAEVRGVFTFKADADFQTVMTALSSGGGEVGLIQAYDLQYKNAAGDIANGLGHLG